MEMVLSRVDNCLLNSERAEERPLATPEGVCTLTWQLPHTHCCRPGSFRRDERGECGDPMSQASTRTQ